MVRGTKRKGAPDAPAGTSAKKPNKQSVAVEASANLSTKIGPNIASSPGTSSKTSEPPENTYGSDGLRTRADMQDEETSAEDDEDAAPTPPRKENHESDEDELGKHALAANSLHSLTRRLKSVLCSAGNLLCMASTYLRLSSATCTVASFTNSPVQRRIVAQRSGGILTRQRRAKRARRRTAGQHRTSVDMRRLASASRW